RVVVIVTWKNPVRAGSINRVTQTTFVSNGQIRVPQTTIAPTAPGGTTHLAMNMPANGTVGQSQTVTVTAQDANNLTTAGYRGTVHFASSDVAANLPADYPFTTADGGVHQFAVTFHTAGLQTIAVSDTSSPTITSGSIPTTEA